MYSFTFDHSALTMSKNKQSLLDVAKISFPPVGNEIFDFLSRFITISTFT